MIIVHRARHDRLAREGGARSARIRGRREDQREHRGDQLVQNAQRGEQPRPHLRATLILSCLAQFMVILDVSVVNVALPAMRSSLHFSEENLQWVVNAYTVTFAGFLLLGGRAADLLGRRRVFVAGLALFALTSLVCG